MVFLYEAEGKQRPMVDDVRSSLNSEIGSSAESISKQPSGVGQKLNVGKMFHPLSGLFILVFDWFLLGSGLLSGLSLMVPLSLIGFGAGALVTTFIQRTMAGDSLMKSLFKGTLAGVAVGIPLPVAGTFMGGIILSMSGLSHLSDAVRLRKSKG